MKNTFGIPIIPDNDKERLKALYRYEILDTPPEGAFNRVASLATRLFRVPIALISLVDEERVFFKANIGMPGVSNVERGKSLCSLAILNQEPTVFKNAAKEPCLLTNPLVAGSFGLKFYAGAPLITSDGYNIGTICIVDKVPREISENDQKMLEDLAAIVMDEIEVRLSSIKALREKTNLMHMAAHDLKSPLQSIQGLSALLKSAGNQEIREKITDLIHGSSVQMIDLINRFVKLSEIENNGISLDLKPFDLKELVKEVVKANKVLASNKEQEIILDTVLREEIPLDKDWMREVFDNLINNAIKYSPPGSPIHVTAKTSDKGLLFEVQDKGPGFSEEDKKKAFQKFSRLSSQPTGGESSTGLGLSIVKSLVELHNGTVFIESSGKNKGSKIVVKIPHVAEKESMQQQ